MNIQPKPQIQRLITRGEIAQLLGVSERFVRENEVRLRLTGCRVDLSYNMVRFRENDVRKILSEIGVM